MVPHCRTNEGPKKLDEADRRSFIEAAWEGLIHIIVAAAEETIGRKSCKARDNITFLNTESMPVTDDKNVWT